MKYSILVIIAAFLFSCTTQNETNNIIADVEQKFINNSNSVQAYLNDFVNESIDYKKFFNDTCKVRGTYFNSEGPTNVDDRISLHKEMWTKYDFAISDSINFLPGVNAETKEMDGSVRFYYDMQVTNSSNGKSVVIPIYESFDFDDEGKAIYVQWYCDWSTSMASLD